MENLCLFVRNFKIFFPVSTIFLINFVLFYFQLRREQELQQQKLWRDFQEQKKEMELQHKMQIENKLQVRILWTFFITYSSKALSFYFLGLRYNNVLMGKDLKILWFQISNEINFPFFGPPYHNVFYDLCLVVFFFGFSGFSFVIYHHYPLYKIVYIVCGKWRIPGTATATYCGRTASNWRTTSRASWSWCSSGSDCKTK